MRIIKRLLAIGITTAGLAVPVSTAAGLAPTASASPADPGPYCRPVVNIPTQTQGPNFNANETYDVQDTVTVELDCNGPIYAGSITATFHWSTSPASNYMAASGAKSGNSISCSDTCTASAFVWRDYNCGTIYKFNDYGQISGYWQETSTSTRVTVSLDGSQHSGGTYWAVESCP